MTDPRLPEVGRHPFSQAVVYEEGLEARIAAALALHVRVTNVTHGCCAAPSLCNGHPDECRSIDHGLHRVSWPCATVRALTEQSDDDRAAAR